VASRIGDLAVLGDRDTVFGELDAESEALNAGYRAHGSLHEVEVPPVIYNGDAKLSADDFRFNRDLARWVYRSLEDSPGHFFKGVISGHWKIPVAQQNLEPPLSPFSALNENLHLKRAYPEVGMRMLSDALISLLNGLHFRADAKRMVSIIPLGSIYWEGEMPDFLQVAKFSEDERIIIWQLFGIRFKIWDNEQLAAEDRSFWDAARSEVPDWALFQRLALSADDRKA
jgi:hypothetical protein